MRTPTKKDLIQTALGENSAESQSALRNLANRYAEQMSADDIDRLAPLLRHPSLTVKLEAAKTMISGHYLGKSYLERALDDPSMEIRLCAAVGLPANQNRADFDKKEAAWSSKPSRAWRRPMMWNPYHG